jgi:hypothetical protein
MIKKYKDFNKFWKYTGKIQIFWYNKSQGKKITEIQRFH